MLRISGSLAPTRRIVLLTALVIGALVPMAAAKATETTVVGCDSATGHHQDATHSGSSCTALPVTPTKRWSVTLAGSVSYPIIADGKVFVTTTPSTNSYGGWLYALDAATGATAWGPVPLTGTYYWSSSAYDAGTLFVNNFDGTITAFDAATGAQRWATTTEYFAGELAARDGVVYEHGAHAVYALSAATGAPVWTSGYLDGDGSSVSVDDEGVYVAAGCSRYRLSLATGSIVWSGNDGCSGGGGGVTYPTATRVFSRASGSSGYVLNKATGATVGSFGGSPAFDNGNVYLANGSAIVAEDVLTLAPKFTTPLPATISTSPVVASGVVYVGAGTNVYAVDGTSGDITWTGAVPTGTSGGGQYTGPTADIAVGEGLLVVPGGNTLTAFGDTVATTTTLSASASSVAFGQTVSLTATVAPTDGGGTVRFSAGASALAGCGEVPLQKVGSAFVAVCRVSALPVGWHLFKAAYSGDEAYRPSETTLTQTVVRATTTIVAKAYQLKGVANGYNGLAFIANLTSNATATGVGGQTVKFAVVGRSCVATTNAQGVATCVLWYAPGTALPDRTWVSFADTAKFVGTRVLQPIALLKG